MPRAYPLLCLLAGCQLAFPFQADGPAPADAQIDTAAPGCIGNGHDEDADVVDDNCDNCPTISNASQANTGELDAMMEADEVGDACDPNPSMAGDAILHYDAMLAAGGFVVTNGTLQAESGTLRLDSNSRIELPNEIVDATNVQLRASIDGPADDGAAFVTIENGSRFCQARSASCDASMDPARSCIIASSGGTPTGMNVAEPLRALRMLEQRLTDCVVVMTGSQQSTPPTAITSPATFAIRSGSLAVVLDSLIIYGRAP